MNDSPKLKVLSYNIHKGFSSGKRRQVLEQMRRAIRAINPDLVFLQEVMGEHRHYSKADERLLEAQFEYLADEVWDHHAYGKNAVYSKGNHGNAILSKFPFIGWENIDVSTNRFEKRGILHGVIELPHLATPLHVLCIHLNIFEVGRRSQIVSLCQRVKDTVKDEPLLICGDFNDWREQIGKSLEYELSLAEVFLQLYGEHARSFPSFFPYLRLDRIYYKGLSPLSAGCLSDHPWKDLSDHLALYADFGF